MLPSLDNNFEDTISTSRKFKKSTTSICDLDYRQSLRHRNIFIEREKAPLKLVRRALKIISRLRTSSELDDIMIKELKDVSRKLQNEAEEELVQ